MKIILAGYIVGYPLGGMTWHHLNYLLGLIELGHDVTYLEDGAFLPPFDPATGNTGDARYGLNYLSQTFANCDIAYVPWHYRFGSVVGGISIEEINRRLREADLLICVSGITPLDWYDRPRRTLVIDTDPVFTQLRMSQDARFLTYYKSFTHVATFGRLIGTADSPLPTHGIDWIPTNQPIVRKYWPETPIASRAFTTIGKWEHTADRTVEFGGRHFGSTKATEWLNLLKLPSSTDLEMRMAMADVPQQTRTAFEKQGWHFDDPVAASRTPGEFAKFIQNSAGEFTVAKEIYAGVPSGWFSDRSACYLMSGRPVVTQSSGFEKWLPCGEGLFSFRTLDDASAALREISIAPQKHGDTARRIAEKYFDSASVLSELLTRVA